MVDRVPTVQDDLHSMTFGRCHTCKIRAWRGAEIPPTVSCIKLYTRAVALNPPPVESLEALRGVGSERVKMVFTFGQFESPPPSWNLG
jgi:hypothetical protein